MGFPKVTVSFSYEVGPDVHCPSCSTPVSVIDSAFTVPFIDDVVCDGVPQIIVNIHDLDRTDFITFRPCGHTVPYSRWFKRTIDIVFGDIPGNENGGITAIRPTRRIGRSYRSVKDTA